MNIEKKFTKNDRPLDHDCTILWIHQLKDKGIDKNPWNKDGWKYHAHKKWQWFITRKTTGMVQVSWSNS